MFSLPSKMYMTPPQCPHIIGYSKYEGNSPEIRSWWCKLFKILEEDATIPPDRKFEVVEKIFPYKLLNKIIDVLNFVESDTNLSDVHKLESHYRQIDTEEKHTNLSKIISSLERKVQLQSVNNRDEPRKSKGTKPKPTTEKLKERNIGPNNPYLNFFNRPPERAAIWHTLPPLSLDEMNLNQKADSITEKIAREFVGWIQNLGGKPITLDVPTVVKMFEVHFDAQAAKSLCVKQKEMPSLPAMVAVSMNLPQMSTRNRLHAQIRSDVNALKESKKLLAFGKCLPTELQVHPPKQGIEEQWLSCKNLPQDLKSMARVWTGITHLRSTRAFCKWLIDHPEIKPPQYLLDSNMLDPAMVLARANSMDTEAGMMSTVVPEGISKGK